MIKMQYKVIVSRGWVITLCKSYAVAEKHACKYRQRTNDDCSIVDLYAEVALLKGNTHD